LACAQLEQLDTFLNNKRITANEYKKFFSNNSIDFIEEPIDSKSNYWLNAILLPSHEERNAFLTQTNDNGVMTRPIWALMHRLDMFKDCIHDGLLNSLDIENRLVNIPSSVRI